MRKKFVIVAALVIVLSAAGCSGSEPMITINPYRGASQYVHVDIGEGYVLRNYERVENDSGCAVTVYFDKKREEK